MPSDKLNIGDFRQQVAGNVELSSGGDHFTIYATGMGSLLSMRSSGSVAVGAGNANLTLENDSLVGGTATLQGGLEGAVKLGVGPPLVGAQLIMLPEEITLSVGPPGVGASIKMTPASIVFQVAETSYEMTPLGIIEKLAATQRELTPVGHTFTAAETELGIAVEGVNYSAPLVQATAEAAAESTDTLGTHATDAINNVENGMLMLA